MADSPPRTPSPSTDAEDDMPDFNMRDEEDPSRVDKSSYGGSWPWEGDDLDCVQMGIILFTTTLFGMISRLDGTLRAAYDMIRFALCGRVYNMASIEAGLSNDLFEEVRIDIGLDSCPDYEETIPDISCDVDSAIVFTSVLGFQDTINVYPITDFSQTLTTSNHLYITIGDQLVPAFHIPNYCLASSRRRCKINVFFPEMHVHNAGSRAIPTDYMEYLYTHVTREAMRDSMDEPFRAHVPVTRTAALNAQRSLQGRISYRTIDIPPHRVRFFSERYRALANQAPDRYAGLRNPIFMIELRGTKGEYRWNMGDNEEREIVFSNIRDLFDEDVREDGLFYVDIGTEIAVPGLCMCMKTAKHANILAWAANIPLDRVRSIVQLSSFVRDPLCQVYDLAGWRYEPARTERNMDLLGSLRYAHAYYTHKDAFNTLGVQNMWSDLDAACMLPARMSSTSEHLGRLCNAIHELKEHGQDGAIRVEVRVKMDKADEYMTDLDPAEAKSWAIGYVTMVFWTFVWCKCRSIKVAVDMLLNTPRSIAGRASSLQAAAILVSMVNALFRRESTWSRDRNLIQASGRRKRNYDDFDDDNVEGAVARSSFIGDQHGMYFISDLMLDHLLADRGLRVPTAAVVLFQDYLPLSFGKHSLVEIQQLYGLHDAQTSKVAPSNPTRTNNRRGALATDVVHIQAGLPNPRPVTVSVNPLIRFHEAPRTAPPAEPGFLADMALTENDEVSDLYVDTKQTVTEYCQWTFRQLPVDLFLCAANLRGRESGSHTVMHPTLRPHATLDIFRTFDLTGVMARATVRYVDAKTWKIISGHAFPCPYSWPHGQLQNYKSCLYWRRWGNVGKGQLDRRSSNEVRNSLRAVLEDLWWLPQFSSDRIWDTSTREYKGVMRLNNENKKPALIIAINPKMAHQAKRELAVGDGPTPAQAALIETLSGGTGDNTDV